MSYIISIHYLLLIFIFVIPNSITIESQLKFFFFNGFNIIRCSDNQVQIYEQDDEFKYLLTKILNCDNGAEIFDSGYVGFVWDKLKIICSSASNQVHEELHVKRMFEGHKVKNTLPDAEGQLGQSKKSYELQVTSDDDGENTVIKSKDQPANDLYFKGRTIYIWFPGHPIICQINFKSEESDSCSSGTEQEIEDVNYACFYNPGADEEPTVEEMIAEFKQVDEAEKPDDKKAYVLDLEKPEISADDSLDSDEDDDPKTPSNSNSKNSNKKKKISLPSNSPKNKKKSSITKIIGLIFGILLLICLIAGIAFYFIRKNRLNQSSLLSSSSSVNIETGNNKSSSLPVRKESQQSLANDVNTEVMKNEPSIKDKPNIALQKSTANKRQRAGTSMAINDDI